MSRGIPNPSRDSGHSWATRLRHQLRTCDERYGIDSETAQDQSWRRETVRGAPPHQRLNRLPKTSLPTCPFPHPHRIDTKKNWGSTAPRSYRTKPSSGLSRLAGKEQSRGQRRIWCVAGNHVPFTLLPHAPSSISSLFTPNSVGNLVRKSEKMVGDTATGLERATGELEDLLVRATHTSL